MSFVSIGRDELARLLAGRMDSEIFVFTTETKPQAYQWLAPMGIVVFYLIERRTFKAILESDYKKNLNKRIIKNPEEKSDVPRFVDTPGTPFVHPPNHKSVSAYLQVRTLEVLKRSCFVDEKEVYGLGNMVDRGWDRGWYARSKKLVCTTHHVNTFIEAIPTGQVFNYSDYFARGFSFT